MKDQSEERTSVSAEMPKYKCHKEVYALKIEKIEVDPPMSHQAAGVETDGNIATITPENKVYSKFRVSALYMEKHKPVVGGYYVVYKDGYKSFSPANAFEGGYSLI